MITIISRDSGAVGKNIIVRTDGNKTEQLDQVCQCLDAMLFLNENISWLIGIYPWSKKSFEHCVSSYETAKIAIAQRHFAGEKKPATALIDKWIHICKQKFGDKNISIGV